MHANQELTSLQTIRALEEELLEECWKFDGLLLFLRKRLRKIRMHKLEELLYHPPSSLQKEAAIFAQLQKKQQKLHNLRHSFVNTRESTLAKVLEDIQNDLHIHLPTEELYPIAQAALHQAVLLFDPDRGITYTSYSRWWMKAKCTRYLEQPTPRDCSVCMKVVGRIIHIP